MSLLITLFLISCFVTVLYSTPDNAFVAAQKDSKKNIVVFDAEKIDVSLKKFEELFIADKAPYGYVQFHEHVKDTKVSATPWKETKQSKTTIEREVGFFQKGLAPTHGIKKQRMTRFKDGLILQTVTTLKDVPEADKFTVEDTMVIQQKSANQVSVEVSMQVTWLKGSFMKWPIESNTNREVAKWQKNLIGFWNKNVKGKEL